MSSLVACLGEGLRALNFFKKRDTFMVSLFLSASPSSILLVKKPGGIFCGTIF